MNTHNKLICSDDIQFLARVLTFAVELQNLHKRFLGRLVILHTSVAIRRIFNDSSSGYCRSKNRKKNRLISDGLW